jgi:hypothetical protein
MSLAACVKEILCDKTVNKAQAASNALEFLDAQIVASYSDDPTEIIQLRNKIFNAMSTPLQDCIEKAVQAIGE